MSPLVWSWLLTALMLVFSWLCGKKIWWAWHYGLATQLLWIVFAVVTAQYGFILGAIASSVIFARNAVEWSRERDEHIEAVSEKYSEVMGETPNHIDYSGDFSLLTEELDEWSDLRKEANGLMLDGAVEWRAVAEFAMDFPATFTHGEDGEPLAQGVLRSVEGLVLEDDEELDIY